MRRRNHGTLNSRRLVAGDPSATAVPLRVQSMQAAWLPAAGRCLLSLQAPTLPSHLHSPLPGFLLPREKWGSRKEARLPRHRCAHQHLRLAQTPFLPVAQTLLETVLRCPTALPGSPTAPECPYTSLWLSVPPSVHSGSFCHQDVSLLPFLSYEAQQTMPSFVPAPHFSTKSYFSYFFIEKKICPLFSFVLSDPLKSSLGFT